VLASRTWFSFVAGSAGVCHDVAGLTLSASETVAWQKDGKTRNAVAASGSKATSYSIAQAKPSGSAPANL